MLGPSGLSAAWGELTVGSLPSHLLRSRGGVGGGGGGGIGGGATSIQIQQRAGGDAHHRHRPRPAHSASGASAGGQFVGSASLPPPRAPFLSSRGWGRGGIGLSAMPEVKLPESVVTSSTDYGSVQYGSLRESRFLGGRSPSSRRPRGPLAEAVGRVDSHGGAPSEFAHTLVSSITGLDILTRTKESQMMTNYNARAENDGLENDAPSNGNESSRQNDGSRLPYDDGVSPAQNNITEGGSSFDNYDQQHGSPDTFEAFDFELE